VNSASKVDSVGKAIHILLVFQIVPLVLSLNTQAWMNNLRVTLIIPIPILFAY
jgi:hypothetical protein